MAFCKAPSCGKLIEWHKTEAGKNIPIDPEPSTKGNIYFKNARAVYGKVGSHPRMFLSHFATCPEAESFRRKRSCSVEGCEIIGAHTHCFECGAPDHLAQDCPDGA